MLWQGSALMHAQALVQVSEPAQVSKGSQQWACTQAAQAGRVRAPPSSGRLAHGSAAPVVAGSVVAGSVVTGVVVAAVVVVVPGSPVPELVGSPVVLAGRPVAAVVVVVGPAVVLLAGSLAATLALASIG